MVKEEIIASLQNGVARGESLEHAMQTMITAGYPDADVQEAARYVNMGIIGKIQDTTQSINQNYTQPQTTPEKKSNKSVWFIVILSLILLGLMGVAAYIFMSNAGA